MSDIRIQTADGGSFEAYLSLPPGGPAPGLVMLPPIYGIEPVIRQLADRYAARGYAVIVPNQFWRDAQPGMMERTDAGRAIAQARMQRVDVELAAADVGATVETVRALPECSGKIAVLGFCFGGRYAYIAAARLPVDAAGAFHGTRIGASLSPAPRVPVSLHFGEDDPIVPIDEVRAIEDAVRGTPDSQVYVYPGASHNFSLPGDPNYVPAVAELSEARVFALFDRMTRGAQT